MMLRTWFLLPVCLASTPTDESVCSHPSSGETRSISLDQVGRAQKELQDRLAISWNKSLHLTKDSGFDSGLPACRTAGTRRLKTRLPSQLVGRSIAFGPSERMPSADIHVATFARRVIDLQADALADPRLIERLGVRCSPTLVRALSEVELELVENP
jgi:hypothetical protein